MYLTKIFRSLARRDEGQDLIEYALLVALISLVCVVAIKSAGTSVDKIFNDIAAKLVVPGGA